MNELMIKLINLYQKATKNGKKHCRFIPTCSNYSKECYMKFNFFKATFLTIWRVIRCNPLSKGGLDPVPLTKKEKQNLPILPKLVPDELIEQIKYYYKN